MGQPTAFRRLSYKERVLVFLLPHTTNPYASVSSCPCVYTPFWGGRDIPTASHKLQKQLFGGKRCCSSPDSLSCSAPCFHHGSSPWLKHGGAVVHA